MFPVVLAIDEIQGGVNKEASMTLISNVIEVARTNARIENVPHGKWCVAKSSILFVRKTGCCTRYEYLVEIHWVK